MQEFGFAEPEEDASPSEALVDVLIENPEIADAADPAREFMPVRSLGCLRRDVLERNPDLVLKLEASGKDSDALAERIRRGFDELDAAGWTRDANVPS